MNFKDWLQLNENYQNIHLFRGIGGPPNPLDRLGRWWSTNPYYAMKYGDVTPGRIFRAMISQVALDTGLSDGSIVDASQDEYPNYIFRNSDPPQAQPMTADELKRFRMLSGDLDQNGQRPSTTGRGPGANRFFQQLWGDEAVQSAYKIYGS